MPSKPHFPKFPHLGSCAWSMNQKVHVFGMRMNWFQVVPKAFMAWLKLPLVLDRMGWKRKEIQLAEASQLFVMSLQLYIIWEMMKMNLARKGLILLDTCPSFALIGQAGTDGDGLQLSIVLRLDWSTHVSFSYWDLYMSWAGLVGLYSWASLGLTIPTKMNGFAMGNIHRLL